MKNGIEELTSKLLNVTEYCLQKGTNGTNVKQMKKNLKCAIQSDENRKIR